MNLPLVNFFLIILLGLLLGQSNTKRNRNIYIFIMMLVFLLEAGLRHPTIGADTANYISSFEYSWDKNLKDVFNVFLNLYFDYSNIEGDVGYTLLEKLIGSITHNWNLFEVIRDLIFFIPLGVYLKKYSTNFYQLVFAMLFYSSLLHSIPMNGGRQLLALGVSVVSFMALQEKKYWLSAFWILLGMSFHRSCLLCFIIMACSFINPKYLKYLHIVSLALIPLVLLNVNYFIIFMGNFAGVERYANYGMGEVQGGSFVFITLLELLSIFCFFSIRKGQMEEDRKIKVFYSTIIGTTLFGPLVWANGAMIRAVMYFYLYMTLLVPYSIDSITLIKGKNTLYIVFIILLGGLYVYGSRADYLFFWQ